VKNVEATGRVGRQAKEEQRGRERERERESEREREGRWEFKPCRRSARRSDEPSGRAAVASTRNGREKGAHQGSTARETRAGDDEACDGKP